MKDGNISMLVYNLLAEERASQSRKHGMGALATFGQFIAIAGEEFGEICKAHCQDDASKFNIEVKQLAAVCIAWLDGDLHWTNKP